MTTTLKPAPAYEQIKTYLREEITSGNLSEGNRIPSENLLAKQFGVARMTANRAVVDLVHQGVLRRVKGSGTFVAPTRYESTVVEIRSINRDVALRGHIHRAKVLFNAEVTPSEVISDELGGARNDRVFHTQMLHYENEQAIQLEYRWVNPQAAPEYLAQDLSQITPTEYLLRVAPLQKVEYRIRAENSSPEVAWALELETGAPVLVLRRRTFSFDTPVTVVELYHPAGRFEFSGSF